MGDKAQRLGLALLGGLWGGAIAGMAEALVIASTASELSEYEFFPYAVIGYALLGALMGLGLGIVSTVIPPLARRLPTPFGLAAAVAFASLAFVVGRYHVDQRFFHEELTPWTASGALAHVGLALLAGGGAALALWAGRQLSRRARAIPIAAAALLALAVVALVVGRSKVASDTLVGTGPRTTAAANSPNVILIIADTLRADAVSAYGRPGSKTPAMDALAADGVRFENVYSQSSWTRPSIATILTSLHPSTHGATNKAAILRDGVVTVAEAFRNAGYWTAAFVSNINIAPVFNFQQGFAEYTYLAPDFYFWASDSSARLALYRMARVLRERFFATRIYVANFYQDAMVVTDHAAAWAKGNTHRPFFLLIHYMDPHDPYFEIPYNGKGVARVTQINPPAARRDELHQLYLQNVGYLDDNLRRLWSELKAAGLYDNSLIVLTADHGEEFQEHGGWWHGTTLYQEQVHVPLIVKRPHEPRAGSTEPQDMRTLDIAPTLLAQSGVPRPRAFEGEDVFAATEQPRTFWAEEDLEGNVLSSIRAGSWKLIAANTNNPRGLQPVELYDLSSDPNEHHNLANGEAARVSEMLALLSRARGGAHGALGR